METLRWPQVAIPRSRQEPPPNLRDVHVVHESQSAAVGAIAAGRHPARPPHPPSRTAQGSGSDHTSAAAIGGAGRRGWPAGLLASPLPCSAWEQSRVALPTTDGAHGAHAGYGPRCPWLATVDAEGNLGACITLLLASNPRVQQQAPVPDAYVQLWAQEL